MTINLIHESVVLDRAIDRTWPGASARVRAGGVDDPWPTYEIMFKNGVVFYGGVKAAVINDAQTYAEATFNLTGEYP